VVRDDGLLEFLSGTAVITVIYYIMTYKSGGYKGEALEIYGSMVVMDLNVGITNYMMGRYHGTGRNDRILSRNQTGITGFGGEGPARKMTSDSIIESTSRGRGDEEDHNYIPHQGKRGGGDLRSVKEY